MPKEVRKYQCNYCIKSWVSKSRAVEHEKKCWKNPDTKSCATCYNCTKNEDWEPWCNDLSKVVFVKGSPISNCPRYENNFDHYREGCEEESDI